MSFFEELKRRNVVRVGIAYAVAAWIILQLTDVVGEIMELPAWGGKLILLMLAVGFLLALILAWAFELTPEGIKRESDVDRDDSIAPKTGRKLDRAIIGLLVLALGYFIWEARFKTPVERPSAPDTVSAVIGQEPATAAPSEGESAGTGKSIVVLPFVNMSADPNQEYFSDGLSEEILNALVPIRDLRVISRTSAFAFKDKELSIPEIAKQLDVSHVLEGSVRTAGEEVRITAQLIEVATDSHLWSQAYSRSLENVFEVQEEISSAIAEQLQLRLSPADRSGRPTENVEAYRLYLRGRHHYQQRGEDDLILAVSLLEQAVAADPNFDEAWATLAAARMVKAYGVEIGFADLYQEAERAAEQAIEINPESGLGHAVIGLMAFGQLDFERAIAQLDRAIALNPGESNSYLWKGIVLSALGYIDESTAIMLEAEQFDPAFANLHNWLADTYLAKGDTRAALHHRDMAAAVDHEFDFNSASELARIDGGPEAEARVVRDVIEAVPDSEDMINAYITALLDPSRTDQAVEAILADDGRHVQIRKTYMLHRLGAVGAALEAWRAEVAAGRTLRASNELAVFWAAHGREKLEAPEIMPFFEEIGMADYWRAHGDPDYCRATGDSFRCGAP
jgi:TolB-like protein/Tfp pilus assembly protein PilF